MLQTHLLVAGMKDVNNEMVFQLVFLVLEVNLVFWFWVVASWAADFQAVFL